MLEDSGSVSFFPHFFPIECWDGLAFWERLMARCFGFSFPKDIPKDSSSLVDFDVSIESFYFSLPP